MESAEDAVKREVLEELSVVVGSNAVSGSPFQTSMYIKVLAITLPIWLLFVQLRICLTLKPADDVAEATGCLS